MNTVDNSRRCAEFYDQLARLTRGISSPRRLELVDLLAQGERSVEDLAGLSGMSVANTSRHLQALKAGRLVAVRRSGLFAFYRLADDGVFALWQAVRDLGERRLASMRELVMTRFADRQAVPAIGLDELVAGLGSGAMLVIDTRPEPEFAAGHIKGAVSVPLDELDARLHVLPMEPEIIACSRGPYCDLADRAFAALRAAGYRARRLAPGVPDWRAAGLPSEGTAAG